MKAKNDDRKIIREDIRSGQFKSAYLLYGEEAYLKQQYKNDLIRALVPEGDEMNFRKVSGKDTDVRDLIDYCETMPFFADHRVVLLEDTGFFKNKCDELADYMKNLPAYLCMIFSETEVDKRSRMYKAVKENGFAAEFTQLDESRLKEWAAGFLKTNGRNISVRDADYLISMTGNDMGNLRNELLKLISYTEGRTLVNAADIDAVCISRTENKMFDMVRAVTEHDQKRAMSLYQDLLTLKEPPMRILALLARQFNQLRLLKNMKREGLGQREIMEKLRIPSFAYRSTEACAEAYSTSQLNRALADLVEADEAVKTGRLTDVLSVELVIIKYCTM